MRETATENPKRRGRPPKELQLSTVIRCSDCGNEFKTDRAFKEHACDQQPFNFDYTVGSNL